MIRIVFLAAAVLLVIWALRSLRRGSSESTPPSPPPSSATPNPRHEEMVACAKCGVHLPRSEAHAGPGGALYCSERHRLEHEGGDARS